MSVAPTSPHFSADIAVARQLAREGRLDEAVNLLTRASHADPGNAELLVELGLTYQSGERYDAARFVFERAVELRSDSDVTPRLRLAHLLEVDQRADLALFNYYRAFSDAQRTRQPLEATMDESMRTLIAHGHQFVRERRRAWFDSYLNPLRTNQANARWDRVDAALAIYLRERAMPPIDARQKPGFMFMPDLATSPFIEPTRLDWPLRNAADIVAPLDAPIDVCVDAAGGAPALIVFQRGIAHFEARTKAPQLIAALAQLPLARIPNHAPDCEIVTLMSGMRTQPQFGRSNSRCRIVVNLFDSAPLDIVCGGERRTLGAAETLAIDPSFGVEYANPEARRVRFVVFDVWHPDLSAAEREAMSTLIAAAVTFDTRVMDLP